MLFRSIGCAGLLVVVLAFFAIGIIGNGSGSPTSQSYKNLTSESSYFDVVRALGHPDEEIEARDVPIPNIVLGYAKPKWVVYVIYSDGNFDKSTSHYLGIVNTRGTVVHASDPKYQSILDLFAYRMTHEVK